MKQVAFGNMNTIYTNDGLVLPQRLDLRDGNEKVSVILNNLVNKWMLYLKDKSKFFEIYLKQWDDYSKILIIYLEDVINSLRYNETITLWGSLGRVKRLEDGNEKYIKIIKKNFPKDFKLKNIKIVIDCANGAGYKAAPKLLKSLGAKVFTIGVKPNGFNINNKCGSTYPYKIQSAVRKFRADVGIAFDGDADRIIMGAD